MILFNYSRKLDRNQEGVKMDEEYDEYLEHLYEEDDRKYEDEIFEKLNGGN